MESLWARGQALELATTATASSPPPGASESRSRRS